MNARGLLLFVTLARLWSGCVCLPASCSILQISFFKTSQVNCYNMNRTTIPADIPTNAESLTILSNKCDIRNVTYIPPLPRLRRLGLNHNCIEYFSWISLRVLPNLRSLSLMNNRLRTVRLDTVIRYLPHLRNVDLRFNKLASFSEYELGRPQVSKVIVNDNPFHCDCELSWLIEKMACLRDCQPGDKGTCCSSCSACFVARGPKGRAYVCKSPRELEKLKLSDVSVSCAAHQSPANPVSISAASAKSPTGFGACQSTTEPAAISAPTEGTRSQIHRNETSLSMTPTGSAQTIMTSSFNAMDTPEQQENEGFPVLYILVQVSRATTDGIRTPNLLVPERV
ncbi:PREDICTED: peroxidasin homolog [Branchiostoma belcheri]|uniref:Peroxidasin homolog n=1 Tax=Branchiostoma belcheri TaxID=7741 RepID=A0A6P4XMP4_BRABE|nr:PREDICTED: peroxidasin homolog [Branchiostoma belcheri]